MPLVSANLTPIGTYSPQDALNICQPLCHKVPTQAIQAYACNMANAMIYTWALWSWTVAPLQVITLTDGVQDYSHGQSDLYRFDQLRIVNTTVVPNEFRELTQKQQLGVELTRKAGIDLMRVYSFQAEINKIRLEKAAAVSSGTVLQLQGSYQANPVKITAANMNSVLNIPDWYFQGYTEALLYQLYKLSDDSRAGTVTITQDGIRNYSGQLGVAIEFLTQMREKEDVGNGEEVVYPEFTLGEGSTAAGGFVLIG
jgi:hypothetical protein